MDKSDNQYIIENEPFTQEPEGALGVELYKAMKKYRNKIAQYNVDSQTITTYSTILTKSIRTAMKMRSEGVTLDQIVCLCTYNQENSAIPLIASILLGNKIASLDPILSLKDTIFLLNQVKPAIIFVVPESVEMIEKAIRNCKLHSKIVVFGESLTHLTFKQFIQPQKNEKAFCINSNVSPQDTAIIFFSSGTTGLAKGICQSHYALWAQAINTLDYEMITSVCLGYPSPYWISSAIFLIATIISGSARIVVKKFDREQVWHLIDQYKISFMFLAPIQASEMCKAGRPDNVSTASLLVVITGGATSPEKQINALRDLLPGTYIGQAYGQTEVAGIFSCFKMNDVKEALLLHYKPTSCGRPLKGISCKVVDPETETVLGPHQQGELRLKSRFVMNGYYNLDSSDTFDQGGWLKTGDIVYYDDDFCFYIIDRIKEMLKYKSWHIAPAMLENIINTHPAVKKSVVIGIPDEEDGDHPMAVIILNNPNEPITAREIEDFVAQQVDDWQRLRAGVKFVETIPVTPSGKIKRRELRNLVLTGKI